MLKRILMAVICAAAAGSAWAGASIGSNGVQAGSFTTLATSGDTTVGDASGDVLTINASSVTLANDTNVSLQGGVAGINFGVAGTFDTLSIDATNRRVGIRATAPHAPLQIGAGSADQYMAIWPGAASNGTIYFGDPDGTPRASLGIATDDTFRINAVGGAGDILFLPNNTQRVVFKVGGNVGIGTGSPSVSLDVVGVVKASSMSIVDAHNLSFGAVTAASTSTVTWTEITDRLGEFVTSSFTVTTTAFYQITADAGASQTAGTGCLLIKVNGSLITGGEACATGLTGLASVLPISITRVLSLTAGDIVRVDASATSANVTFLKAHLAISQIP